MLNDVFAELSLERVLLALLLLAQLRSLLAVLERDGLRGLYKMVAGAVLTGLSRAIPGVAAIVKAETSKELAKLEAQLLGDGDPTALIRIPDGRSAAAVKQQVAALHEEEVTRAARKRWGGIYHSAGGELAQLQGDVWSLYSQTNALYPGVFPSLRKYEAEIVSMVVGMVHGHECGAVGLLASGGTEAVLLAALAYREAGRARGISRPEIVASLSCHPAIFKACKYFGIELITVPFEPETMQLRASTVARHMTSNTVAIYASAPSFAHGVVDAIEELGALALERRVGLHVDNCLGGFLLSYMRKLGRLADPFDFEVSGVTSMSVDVHKYGFAAKGVSVVAFRDPLLRQATYMPSADGCEGLYVTPTIQGSRSGAVIAAAWATIVHLGDGGYRHAASSIADCHEKIQAAVRAMPRVELACESVGCVVPVVGKDGLNVYALASLLDERGWSVFTGQKPATLAIPVGEQTPSHVDEFLADLREAVNALIEDPSIKPAGNAAVYGAAAALPSSVLEGVLRGYVDITLTVKGSVGGKERKARSPARARG